MKKLLVMLGVFNFSVVSPGLIISCVTKPNTDQEENNGIDYQGDLKILNEITKKISAAFQEYAMEKALVDINDYPINGLEKLFTMVSKKQSQRQLNLNDENVSSGLNALINGFLTIFDNFNREIADQYSNYYINKLPLSADAKGYQFMLNHIDTEQLK